MENNYAVGPLVEESENFEIELQKRLFNQRAVIGNIRDKFMVVYKQAEISINLLKNFNVDNFENKMAVDMCNNILSKSMRTFVPNM